MSWSNLLNRSALFKHGLSLIGSLAIHAGIIYLLATHFASVKIIKFGEQVTPVIIAPPVRLEVPSIEQNVVNLPEVDTDFPEFISRRTRLLPAPAAIPEESSEAAPGEPADQKLASGFQLSPTSPEKPGTISGDRLRLPLAERKRGVLGNVTGVPSPSKKVDWRKYLYAGSAGIPGSVYGYIGGRPGRASLRRGPATASVRGYDLSSWAGRVIELIQRNWMPQPAAARSEEEVELAVTILKTGEISAVEIISSSDDRDFDQTARDAIEISSPLPALPQDFPAASIEISFVFSKK
jgi:TonB family protein